jgi:hypothetical protein
MVASCARRLDDARCIVVGALSDLIDAPEDAPLEEKIDVAKAAIEEWIECLEWRYLDHSTLAEDRK